MSKKAIVSVINDLNNDRRVHKTCLALMKCGYEVTLIGRKLSNSDAMEHRPYQCIRMNLLFTSGPLFYFFFNLRLLIRLLSQKCDLLYSNDLDTIASNYSAFKIKGCKLIYDSHELFTEVPELQNSNIKRKIWKWLEKKTVPKLKNLITVNSSIANIYNDQYKVKFNVVRNIPENQPMMTNTGQPNLQLGNKHLIIIQGSGINIDRGAEEAVEAMQFIDNGILFIIGSGDVIPALKDLTNKNKLNDKVKFIGRLPYKELVQYTKRASIGLTLDKDTNLNYRYSLPNKLFDYINCNVPVLSSKLPELEHIVSTYHIGELIESHNPKHIAEKIKFMLSSEEQLKSWQNNCRQAATELNWQKEEAVLLKFINSIE